MSEAEQALARRIRELRRRHFGSQGKAAFAERLGLPLEDYARYETGAVPPGEVMVRMCELAGEDLQWLLTGVAARGTVVIAGARGRHRDLLARLARTLEEQPELAAPVEAFVDLLLQGRSAPAAAPVALPPAAVADLIPIFEPDELPAALPPGSNDELRERFALACSAGSTAATADASAELSEPAMRYDPAAGRPVEIVTLRTADGRTQRCVRSAEIARCFPGAFAVRVTDESMQPMFRAGDAVLVASGATAKVGRPALCRAVDGAGTRCRIWLGGEQDVVHLGRLADGADEPVAKEHVLWSLEVLFRLALAA